MLAIVNNVIDDPRVRHSLMAKALLSWTPFTPTIPYNITRFCWISINLGKPDKNSFAEINISDAKKKSPSDDEDPGVSQSLIVKAPLPWTQTMLDFHQCTNA